MKSILDCQTVSKLCIYGSINTKGPKQAPLKRSISPTLNKIQLVGWVLILQANLSSN